MRTVLRSIWDWIRSIFLPAGDRSPSSDEIFQRIDVERTLKKLRIQKKARRFGEKDLPATDDPNLDAPQLLLEQFVHERINDALRAANVEWQKMRAALLARDVGPAVRRLQPETSAASGPTIDQLRLEHEIRLLEARRSSIAGELQAYREKYGVAREPDLKDLSDRRLKLGWVILLALVQAFANSLFFASGSRWGLSFGLSLAVVLGLADVLAHVHLGRGMSQIVGARWVDRALGGLLLAVVLISVPGWNLGIVHLRNVVRTLGFDTGVEQWLPSLLQSPFGFTDFMSWALLAIGLACSVSAVLAGWSWNERDPTLRRLGGQLAELDGDVEELRWDAREMEDDHRALTEAEMAELQGQILNDLEMAESLVARMRRLEANREIFLHDAEAAYAAMVRAYRDENRMVRTTPPPTYFTQRATLGPLIEADKFNLEELRRILADQKKLARSVTEAASEVTS